MLETKRKNLTRSEDEVPKNLFFKVVGRKGARKEILAPLLPGEYLDREGLVVREGRRRMAVTRGIQEATESLWAGPRWSPARTRTTCRCRTRQRMWGSTCQWRGQAQEITWALRSAQMEGDLKFFKNSGHQ